MRSSHYLNVKKIFNFQTAMRSVSLFDQAKFAKGNGNVSEKL